MANYQVQEVSIGSNANKMKNNKIKKLTVLILLIGITFLLTGCPGRQDDVYPVAQEQYLMGWILHNIDDSTPTTLSYSYADLAIYNFLFDRHAT